MNMPRPSMLWIYGLIGAFIIGWYVFGDVNDTPLPSDWTTVREMVEKGDVEKIQVVNRDQAQVFLKKEAAEQYRRDTVDKRFKRLPETGVQLTFTIGSVDSFREDLKNAEQQSGQTVPVVYENKANDWTNVLINLLPWVLIIGVWIFIMRSMSRGAGGGAGGGRRGGPKVFRGADVSYSLEITLEQAVAGAKTDIRVPVWEECETCHGSGCKSGTSKKTCPHCGGSGMININRGFLQVQQTCPYCHGTGEIIADPCPDCQGRGRNRKTKTLEINIPAGINDGQRIRIQGKGEPGPNGGPCGDLFVQVFIKQHEIFQRDGDDLHADLPLSFATAALGGEVSVPTMGTEARITIPEGTQTGKIFRLRGKGVPHLHGGGNGDLYVHAFVETPVNLTSKQKKMLKEFDESIKEGGTKHSPQSTSFLDKMKKFFS